MLAVFFVEIVYSMFTLCGSIQPTTDTGNGLLSLIQMLPVVTQGGNERKLCAQD